MSSVNARQVRNLDYRRLYRSVYNRLATALADAQSRGIMNMVLTAPRTGFFSNGDREYVRTVKQAAEDVAEKYRRAFKKIVMCS